MRSLSIGVSLPGRPAPHATAFPDHRSGDPAEWCWVDRDGAYRAYAVTTDEPPLLVAVYHGARDHRPGGVPSRFGGTD